MAEPALLQAFETHLGASLDATLIVYAPDVDPAALDAELTSVVTAAGLAGDDCAEIVGLAVPSDEPNEQALAEQVDYLLSRRLTPPGAFASLARIDDSQAELLGRLAEQRLSEAAAEELSPGTASRRAERIFTPSRYTSRPIPDYFHDALLQDEGILHQPQVYPFAAHLARSLECTTIVDIGCGSGHRVAALAPEFETVGVDLGPNIERARAAWPAARWIEWDLESVAPLPIDEEILSKSVVVCADVIEHLRDPSILLAGLRQALEHAPMAVLSTPDRLLVRGADDLGPPANPHHVREWTLAELEGLLRAAGLRVVFSGLTENNDRDRDKKTALVVLAGKGFPELIEPVPDFFRVVAFVTVYNEVDVLEGTVLDLVDQGVDVYVIDNWSDDGSYELAVSLVGRGLIGVERFPASGPTHHYEWGRLLARVEELACETNTSWCIHHDADERRRSPWPGISLRRALYHADRWGFNTVDHTVLVFSPVDDGFCRDDDLEQALPYFELGDRSGHFVQVKAWKNVARVDLAGTGGHEARFPGRRLHPFKFLLKHYPIRSQAHGEHKVFRDRAPRWANDERAKGWHSQYDELELGQSFLRSPDSLEPFDEERFARNYLVERLSGIGIQPDTAPAAQITRRTIMRLSDFEPFADTGVRVPPGGERSFDYADGAEEPLMNALRGVRDLGLLSPELRAHVHDWASLYHLSPYRAALLDCLGLTRRDARVLELGAGCGAVTRLLGERLDDVVAVEGSIARAAVARARCRDLDGVEVFAANFYDLELDGGFELATLVGVLEYAHLYHPDRPLPEEGAGACLRLAHSALEPDGALVVAIENRLGLKYLLGAGEDHTSRPYESVEGYPDCNSAVTWSLPALRALLADNGFAACDVLLPFPDYKLPSTVLNADWLDPVLRLHEWVDTPFPDRTAERPPACNEGLALREVAVAGLLADLSNSFLVVAYRGDPERARAAAGIDLDWGARRYSLDRAPGRAKRATLRRADDGSLHVEHQSFDGVEPRPGPVSQRFETEPFAEGETLVNQLLRAARSPFPETELRALADRFEAYLVGELGTGPLDDAGVPLLDGSAIDAVWWNVVVDPRSGVWTLIDREWRADSPIPVDYVVWRATEHLAGRYGAYLGEPALRILRELRPLDESRRRSFVRLEQAFLRSALGVDDEREAPSGVEQVPVASTAPIRGLAFADELIASPDLLRSWGEAFGPADAILAIYEPNADAEELGRRLLPLVERLGLDGPESAELIAVSQMPDTSAEIVECFDVVYTRRDNVGPFACLDRISDADLSARGTRRAA